LKRLGTQFLTCVAIHFRDQLIAASLKLTNLPRLESNGDISAIN